MGTQVTTDVIADDAVTNAKLAAMDVNTVKGCIAGGEPIDLTQAQLNSLINIFAGSAPGFVPTSAGGTTNFLRADGTYAAPNLAVSGILGTIATRVVNTVYLAATDGFIYGYTQSNGSAEIYSDTSNPPTTIRCYTGSNNFVSGFCVPVNKGSYYKVTSTPEIIFWIPLGT